MPYHMVSWQCSGDAIKGNPIALRRTFCPKLASCERISSVPSAHPHRFPAGFDSQDGNAAHFATPLDALICVALKSRLSDVDISKSLPRNLSQ
jgi:hypothetical protein